MFIKIEIFENVFAILQLRSTISAISSADMSSFRLFFFKISTNLSFDKNIEIQ